MNKNHNDEYIGLTKKQLHDHILSQFTIGELDNPITLQSIIEKLESIDKSVIT